MVCDLRLVDFDVFCAFLCIKVCDRNYDSWQRITQ